MLTESFDFKNKIINDNCVVGLKAIPDKSIDCCVTSPPYFGLRDYGTATWIGGSEECDHQTPDNDMKNAGEKQQTSKGTIRYERSVCRKCGAIREDEQIGMEETPELFVEQLVSVFTEVNRVLKPEGTLWLNLGDSYARAGWRNNNDKPGVKQKTNNGTNISGIKIKTDCKAKDLIGIPWMVAFALRSAGWYLRQDIIWNKPNPMPESVTDRCTKSHEYIFLMSKSAKYYYDADSIKTPIQDASVQRLMQDIENQKGSERVPGKTNGNMKAVIKGYEHRGVEGDKKLTGRSGNFDANGDLIGDGNANKKSVWTVTTRPFKDAHFATFPERLIVDCIKAGCPENGIVLDPFMGAGTTALVARKLNRNYLGFELNPEYIKIANNRLYKELGMYL